EHRRAVDALIVRPGVGRVVVVLEDAEAGGGAGHVRAVAVAVERVGIRHRRRVAVLAGGVVVVADEVGAALHLGRAGAEKRRVGRRGVHRERGFVAVDRSGTAEVLVRVIDAGVDDADLDSLTVHAARAGPGDRRPDARDAGDVHALVHDDRSYGG